MHKLIIDGWGKGCKPWREVQGCTIVVTQLANQMVSALAVWPQSSVLKHEAGLPYIQPSHGMPFDWKVVAPNTGMACFASRILAPELAIQAG